MNCMAALQAAAPGKAQSLTKHNVLSSTLAAAGHLRMNQRLALALVQFTPNIPLCCCLPVQQQQRAYVHKWIEPSYSCQAATVEVRRTCPYLGYCLILLLQVSLWLGHCLRRAQGDRPQAGNTCKAAVGSSPVWPSEPDAPGPSPPVWFSAPGDSK